MRDERKHAQLIRSDTLTILLCYRINQYLEPKHLMICISRCCKTVRDRTKDEDMYKACKNLIKWISKGNYPEVHAQLTKAERLYYSEYKREVV